MKQELNRKLPVTGSYYNFDELSKTGVEQSFFEIFRRMAGLDKKIFPDEYLQNISDGDMSDFIKKLAIEGVNRDE